MAQLQDTTFANLVLPEGTTAQRPGSPVAGMTRYNTTINLIEFYDNGWRPVTGISKGTLGTGGQSIRYAGNSSSSQSGSIAHLFTTVGNHTFTPTFTGTVEVLIVAGGGSGGSHWGGGGGGGGVVHSRVYPVTNGSGTGCTVDVLMTDSVIDNITVAQTATGGAFVKGETITITDGASNTLTIVINSIQAAILNGTLNTATELPIEAGDVFNAVLTVKNNASQTNVAGKVLDTIGDNVVRTYLLKMKVV